MPMLLYKNPYHNLAVLPPQPVSSVEGPNVMFSAYSETGGLQQGYNFVDFGNKVHGHQEMDIIHKNTPYVDPLQWESMDPSNILPQNMPRYYVEKQNFSFLNNPPPQNPNFDYSSQRTTIPPGYLTKNEGYPTVSPIMIGLYNSKLTLGTASFN